MKMNDYKKNPKLLFWDLGQPESSELKRALKHLFKEVYPQIYSFVLKNSGGGPDARALTNQGLKILYDMRRQKDFKAKNIYGLLYQICRYKWLDHLKRKNLIDLVIDTKESPVLRKLSETEEQADRAIRNERRNAIIREELAKMNEPGQGILMDKYFGGLSLKEIAANYKVTVGYVSQILYRGRASLRKKLINRPDFEL